MRGALKLDESTNRFWGFVASALVDLPWSPIDVTVHHKLGQLLHGAWRGLLGDGMLERARATSLGLLGATAAVGLAIVAVGLNQDWPLVPGSAIPDVPQLHQNVDRATVAARPPGPQVQKQEVSGQISTGRHRAGDGGSSHPDGGLTSEPAPGDTAESVVSPAAPAPPHSDGQRPPHGSPEPAAPEQPQPESSPPPAPEPVPAPQAPVPVSSPPPPTTASSDAPPDDSSVPSWSHGHGHAYGRGEEWGDQDSDGEGDEDWDDDHDQGWHGHHWGDDGD